MCFNEYFMKNTIQSFKKKMISDIIKKYHKHEKMLRTQHQAALDSCLMYICIQALLCKILIFVA